MSDLQRIQRIIKFYYNRGICKESVNRVYYLLLKVKYENRN